MRRTAIALLMVLGGCRGSYPPQEAVLTFVPTAMKVTGLAAPASNDPNTICLIAGASVEAEIHVSRSPVTIVLIAFTPTPATVPSFELRVGPTLIASDVISTVTPKILAYNASPDRGAHVLRVGMPGTSPGVLCVQQVAVTQR